MARIDPIHFDLMMIGKNGPRKRTSEFLFISMTIELKRENERNGKFPGGTAYKKPI